jgi:O-methyltransferase
MIKNRIRGKLKGLFFVLKLHRLFPQNLPGFISQLGELSRWIAGHRDVGYSDFYTIQFDYSLRYKLYSYIIESENLNGPFDYIEFGVSEGLSFKWWAEHIKENNARFYGFDTFTGLPEDWGNFKKGDMATNNKPPEMNDTRCRFYEGLFQQTLPEFLKSYTPGRRKVIHMDADLYSSTLFTLTSVSPFLQKGDIILFDEFNVPMHEFKAFTEWTKSYYINYEVIGAVNNFYQVAIKIV